MSGKRHRCWTISCLVPCRYCQNLNYAQQLLQPVDPSKYTDYNCVLPVSRCLDILIAEAVVYFVAAIYFDNVFADTNGVRRKPWCALLPLSCLSHLSRACLCFACGSADATSMSNM